MSKGHPLGAHGMRRASSWRFPKPRMGGFSLRSQASAASTLSARRGPPNLTAFATPTLRPIRRIWCAVDGQNAVGSAEIPAGAQNLPGGAQTFGGLGTALRSPTELLINTLSMISPYGPEEKQAFSQEARDLKARSEVLMALAEMEIARPTLVGQAYTKYALSEASFGMRACCEMGANSPRAVLVWRLASPNCRASSPQIWRHFEDGTLAHVDETCETQFQQSPPYAFRIRFSS